MLTLNNLYVAVFSVLCCASLAAAQSEASYKTAPESGKSARFVSLDGGFSIDLPRQAESFEPIDPIPYVSRGGRKFVWKCEAGFFYVEYVSAATPPANPAANLAEASERSIKQLTANGATLLSKTARTIDDKAALDLVFSKGENIFLIRSLWAGDQLYALSTYWPKTENGSAQIRILDSFKWIHSEA